MTKIPLHFRACLLAAALFADGAGGVLPALAQEEKCFSDWDEARPLIKENGLVSGKAITELARAKGPADFLKATLCEAGGRYVYRLYFIDETTKVIEIEVDAKEPVFPG